MQSKSVSGQVPCFLSLGSSPWGDTSSSWSTRREDVTLSPFHSCQAFWEHGHKEDYHSRSGKLPGFTSTTQRALKSQISAMAQGRAVGVFWCPHRPPKACTSLILHWYSQQHETCPGLQLWLFGQVKSKAKKLPRSAKQEKKMLALVSPSHWGAQSGATL